MIKWSHKLISHRIGALLLAIGILDVVDNILHSVPLSSELIRCLRKVTEVSECGSRPVVQADLEVVKSCRLELQPLLVGEVETADEVERNGHIALTLRVVKFLYRVLK